MIGHVSQFYTSVSQSAGSTGPAKEYDKRRERIPQTRTLPGCFKAEGDDIRLTDDRQGETSD
jgi:hypothetical protein